MSQRRILITGATGSTGRETVALLRAEGQEVRALVHADDQRAAALRKSGAEVLVGDLLDFASVRAAVDGVQAAYFVYPIKPGILEATAYFAQAAKEAGVEGIVNMSQISARREAKSHAAFDHWIAERVFDWSGLPCTHLRPTLFAEWALYWAAFYKGGVLHLPFGTGHHAPIAAVDQARVIARILLSPGSHAGKVYPLYGSREVTFPEMTAEISRVLAKPILYEQVAVPVLREAVEQQGRMLGDFFWQHLTEIAVDHQNGIFAGTNHIVEEVGGQAPVALEEFLKLHRAQLLSSFVPEVSMLPGQHAA